MMERAAAQSVVSAQDVPEDVFWFATQVPPSPSPAQFNHHPRPPTHPNNSHKNLVYSDVLMFTPQQNPLRSSAMARESRPWLSLTAMPVCR